MNTIYFKIPKGENDIYYHQIDQSPYFYFKLHQHPELQITYIKSGTGTLIAGNYSGKFHRGDIFIIGSYIPHIFRYNNKQNANGESSVGISLYIDLNILKNSFFSLGEMSVALHFYLNNHTVYHGSEGRCNFISEGLASMDSLTGFAKTLKTLELLYGIYKHKNLMKPLCIGSYMNNMEEYGIDRIRDVINFTLKEYYRPLALKEVASSVAHMSVEAFCRYFKLHTRKTYISYLNEIRINKATKLLMENNMSKSDIAYRVGFNNVSSFNRVFKSIVGRTPTEYVELVASDEKYI